MTSLNFSNEPSARPPAMMIRAEVSSGRVFSESRFSTKADRPGLAAALMLSTEAEPPSDAAWKEAVRTVITFLASVACTVWIAFPAYIGRLNVSDDATSTISETCMTSSRAATRGVGRVGRAASAGGGEGGGGGGGGEGAGVGLGGEGESGDVLFVY